MTRATNAIYPNIATMELEDIQAIILHDRPAPYYGTLVALKVNDSNVGRELLKAVLPNVTGSKISKRYGCQFDHCDDV